MKNLRLYKIALIIASILFGNLIFLAQDTNSILDESVEVFKQFEAQIAGATPIEINPKFELEEVHSPLSFEYQLPKKEFDIIYPDPVIKPLAYTDKEYIDRKNGYLKLGYGNLKSPFAEGQLSYNIQDWFEVGLSLRHLSADDESLLNQKMSDTYLGANVGLFLGPHSKIYLDGNTRIQDRHFYTYEPLKSMLASLELEGQKRDINDYDINLHFDHNSFEKRGLSSKNEVGYRHFDVNDNHKEYQLHFNNTTNKAIGKNLSVALEAGVEYFNSSIDSTYKTNTIFYQANPSLLYKKNRFDIRIGANIANPDSLQLCPTAKANYHLDNGVSIFASVDVSYDRMGFKQIFNQNNFVTNLDIESSLDNLNFHEVKEFGVGASFQKTKTDVLLTLNYSLEKQILSFVTMNDIELSTAYGDGNRFKANILGSYQLNPTFKFSGDLFYQTIQSDVIVLSYLPKFGGSIRIDESIFNDKLTFFQELDFRGKRDFVNTFDNSMESLDAYFDISAGLDFQFSEWLGVFVQAGNLLNKRYDIYNGYPSYGINFHGGIKVIF